MNLVKITLLSVMLISTAANAESKATKTNETAKLKQIIANQQKEIASLKAKQLDAQEPASGNSPFQKKEEDNVLLKNKTLYMKK